MPALTDVIPVVIEAGDALRKLQDVTEADALSHSILTTRLTRYGIPILSEEGEHAELKSLEWIIDPLDGTREYRAGLDEGCVMGGVPRPRTPQYPAGPHQWCVMVGLLRDGNPELGVVYAPTYRTLWYAQRGVGAYLREKGEDRRLSVSKTQQMSGGLAVVSRYHVSDNARLRFDALGCDTRTMGSMGLKIATIASGEADAYWSDGALGEWDVCAPQIILEEAGGTMSDTQGNPLRYGTESRRLAGGCAASNGLLQCALCADITA